MINQTYQNQLAQKHALLQEWLAPYYSKRIEIYDSEQRHYRMRAEFRVWHDGDDLYHIMFDQQTGARYRVDKFEAASKTINRVMDALIPLLKGNEVLRKKLFQIDYLSGLSGEIVVSLVYHKSLDDNWLQEAKKLRESLRPHFDIDFIGRAKKQKILVDRDFIIEKLSIKDRNFSFKHIENSFTQPNAKVNIKMIEWAADIATNCEDDLLEFYCGAGNFSIPLAKYFNHVVGTEIAKPSVEAAQINIADNQIDNVTIVRLSAEEFVEALLGKRTFNRLKGMDLSHFNFRTVLVDPPRAGLDQATLRCVQHFDNIIYISCNPKTLVENLACLTQTHTVQQAALFDQFPFTSHMESGVWLTRI